MARRNKALLRSPVIRDQVTRMEVVDVAPEMKKAIIIAVALVCLAACIVRLSRGGSRLCPNVNIGNIRMVQLGMTQAEVIRILGDPYARDPGIYGTNTTVMRYSRPVRLARWYPMLWVHLRNDTVMEVYAKRYVDWGMDNVGVYGLSESRKQWETADFEFTFPRR